MICEYCQSIHSVKNAYPLREATKDVDSDYPRCDWHWRFICSICRKPRHYNGITWCEKTRRFICLSCMRSHKVVHRNFWKWRSYYAIECDVCKEQHPALDYLEFLGEHPWQLHFDMQRNREGLDHEVKLQKVTSIYFPIKKAKVNEKQISQAWDKVADKWNRKYTEYGDMNRQYVIDPAILRLIGPVKGLSILDAGCGNGYLCRLLAGKGAKVFGVDVSKRFIEIARQREKETPQKIKYYLGSLHHLSMFQDETFDIAVSNLVLMDVKHLDKAIKELKRVLKKNGKLVFSIMHPCFSSPPVHGWVRKPQDSNRKEDWLYWKVDKYFHRSMEKWQYFDWPPVFSFHRPLEDYMKVLIQNNFAITNFEEPVPTKKAIKEHHRELGNEYDRIPWFLVMAAKKQ